MQRFFVLHFYSFLQDEIIEYAFSCDCVCFMYAKNFEFLTMCVILECEFDIK